MTKQRLGFLLTVTSILITGSAIAQSRICANKTTGNILIRPTCFGSENTITNIAGLRGPTGPIGPRGIQGVAGAQGIQGLKGNTGAQGVQGATGPQGTPGTNVDISKCHPSALWRDNQAPNEGEWRPCSSLFCAPNEFLLSHHWEQESWPYSLEETNYHVGGSTTSAPGNSLPEPSTPILSSDYCGSFPEDQPGYVGDPHGSGTCCPLPQ